MKNLIKVTSTMHNSIEPILINIYQIESVFSQGQQGCAIRMISGEIYYVADVFESICEQIDQLK